MVVRGPTDYKSAIICNGNIWISLLALPIGIDLLLLAYRRTFGIVMLQVDLARSPTMNIGSLPDRNVTTPRAPINRHVHLITSRALIDEKLPAKHTYLYGDWG